jgi:hypothetical protein
LDLLGRFGIGTAREMSVDDVKDRLAETVSAIQRIVSAPQREELLATLRVVWS